METPTPDAPFADKQLGTFYPRDQVVAMLPDRERVGAAVEDLDRAGVTSGHVRTWSGPEVVAWREAAVQDRSLTEKIGAFISDEDLWADEYRDIAAHGEYLLIAPAPDEETAERIARVLGQHGGHTMRYYGNATVLDLMPD